MGKNRKRNKSESKKSASNARISLPPLPPIFTVDALGEMLDEDLYNHITELGAQRDKVFQISRRETIPWEVEYCYAQNELQMRRKRRRAHEAYMTQLQNESYVNEDDLPFADLDNKEFVRLSEMLRR
jgi:hypothetical protein